MDNIAERVIRNCHQSVWCAINYGVFINTIISFILVAFAVFLLIKFINKLKAVALKDCEKEEEATTKTCPKCFTTIDIRATRCPNCTSEI